MTTTQQNTQQSTQATQQPITATPEDQALKVKHAALWASGSYAPVAEHVLVA